MTELDFARILQDVADEERLSANWQTIQKKHARRTATVPIAWLVAAITILGIGATAFFELYLESDSIEALTLINDGRGTPVTAFDTRHLTQSVKLSDGSALYLNRHTELVVFENTGDRFETKLNRGRVRFDVRPGGTRMWVVAAGQLRIEVVGTSFTVETTPQLTRVRVHRGKVRVQGDGVNKGGRELEKGDEIVVSRKKKKRDDEDNRRKSLEESASRSERDSLATGMANNMTNEPPARAQAATLASNAEGDALAGVSQGIDNASDPIGSKGKSTKSPVRLLLSQADEARQTGDSQLALQYLNQIVSDYPNDTAAGLAAFTIGRIYLHDLNQYAAAAASFSRAIALGLPHGLEEQAYAKQVESWRHTNNITRLQHAADVYNRRFPDGTWKQWVARWTQYE